MSSNYPPGAANDPNAPYNQEDPPVVEVTVRETLIKETSISSCCGHWVNDYEYDPDEGRSIGTSYYEAGNVEEDFKEQSRTACQCLQVCCMVLRQLLKDGKRFYGRVNIASLLDDCDNWEQEEIVIKDGNLIDFV